jgi:hypothetical protein
MAQGARRGVWALALTALAISPLAAQNGQPTHDDNVMTLRVYPDLEGDDPVSLAILLDPSEPEAELMEWIDDAISELAPRSLTSRDRLSVYAIDCQLFRSSVDDPADFVAVKQAVDSVLESWNMRSGGRQSANCPNRRYLWDSVTVVTKELRAQHGLRVMLVVSDGVDGGSKNNWNLARWYAQDSSVAIFGISRAPNSRFASREVRTENAFNSVCQLSGGMLLMTDPDDLAKQLKWFMKMIRGRYIVEFPHPATKKPSILTMEITIAKSDAFIRPAGAAVSVDDPKILNDPMTVHPDTSYAPQVGNRGVMTPH